jgi:hypothetical protein
MRRAVLLIIPLVAGCYVYRPVTGGVSPSSDRVRLTLTDAGVAGLAARLGPSTVEVSGRLVGDSADAWLVSVLATRARDGVESDWSGEQVAIERVFVSRVEQRHFSRSRTLLAGTAALVGALAARTAFWGPGGVFGGARSGSGGNPR